MSSILIFYLNGTRIELNNPDPDTTLLQYVRSTGLTGSKLGCAEGGCGACTMLVSTYDAKMQKIVHTSVNGCLAPLVSMDGKHVITVEGIGTAENPHPVQERIGQMFGSQCGFCTPGIVMSLYALLRNNPNPTEKEIEESFDGNLCRCTGYRPILDAAKTFAIDGCCKTKLSGANKSECNNLLACCQSSDINMITNVAATDDTSISNGIEKKGCGITNCCQLNENSSKANFPTFPPIKFKKHDPSTELIFPPLLMRHTPRLLTFTSIRKKWFRPTTLNQLTQLKKEYPHAKLVSGNSEVGVEVKFKKMDYQVCISTTEIDELKTLEWSDDGIIVGANMTLTVFEDVLKEGIRRYGYKDKPLFEAFLSNLRYFAGRQIRNVATLAGNIATASPISDFNPIFLASESILHVLRPSDGSIRKEPMTTFFKGYRNTALELEDVILNIEIPLLKSTCDYIRAFKQAHRKDDDIAIANAALRVVIDPETLVVARAVLAFGGLAPTTVRALNAERCLIGKKIGDPVLLEEVMSILVDKDFNLPFGVPGGMPVYRKSLAMGFFYRFWNDVGLSLSRELKRKASHIEFDVGAITSIEREVSHGRRLYDDKIPKDRIVGKAIIHSAAMKQVTGEAIYVDDIPKRQREAYGALVMSTKAHAKILSIDPSVALAQDGVVDFISAKDVRGSNIWSPPAMDEPFFATEEVHFVGQVIGVIVAETQAQVQTAARLVKVEYEELPHILTIEEAIAAESFFPPVRGMKNGDVEAAFKEADYVFEGQTRIGGQEHFYLETFAVLAVPGEGNEMEIFCSTQNPSETQVFVANILGVTANQVNVRVKRMGGAFGGKESRPVAFAAVMALAARKANRPVRCMLDRDEDMMISGQRHPFLGKWKVGVTKEGKILGLQLRLYNNGGWSQDLSCAVLERGLFHSDGCYKIPNVDLRGRICKTNIHSNTAFRGFGGPQGMFICESWLHEVADKLNISVDKLQEMNFYKEGESTHFNQKLEDWYLPDIYAQVKKSSEYEKRQEEVVVFNRKNRWRKQGLAISPTKFGISFTALQLNQAGALVHIYHDGSVLVAHGGTEMGQGLHTKMCMIAAEELGVSLESVHISETTTITVPNASATAASASSDLNGMAIKNSCDQLNERLAPYRAKNPGGSMAEIAHAAYMDRVSLSAAGFYKTPDIGYSWSENCGNPFAYFTLGACVSHVEMDVLTGDHTILRTDLLMDVGNTLNSAIDVGQIEGGFMQGVGLFTIEETLFLQNGSLFTKGPGTYKIPGFRDVPQDFRVGLYQGKEYKSLRTIGRSKGIGEPPLALGFTVFFALREAIKSARKDAGVNEILCLESPATPERIRLTCGDSIVQKAIKGVVKKKEEKEFFVYV